MLNINQGKQKIISLHVYVDSDNNTTKFRNPEKVKHLDGKFYYHVWFIDVTDLSKKEINAIYINSRRAKVLEDFKEAVGDYHEYYIDGNKQ